MGKTVQIDDDVMRAAERLAAERGTTPGAVISELARRELTRPAAGASHQAQWLLCTALAR